MSLLNVSGKRVCVGENFAKLELFMYLTSFIQKFEFSLPEEESGITEVFVTAAERSPMPFNLIAKQRNKDSHQTD